MDRKTIVLISIILCVSAIVRLWGLDRSPLSLNWDEAALGYNAYSLLTTGKDEFGSAFPLSLRSVSYTHLDVYKRQDIHNPMQTK